LVGRIEKEDTRSARLRECGGATGVQEGVRPLGVTLYLYVGGRVTEAAGALYSVRRLSRTGLPATQAHLSHSLPAKQRVQPLFHNPRVEARVLAVQGIAGCEWLEGLGHIHLRLPAHAHCI